MRRHSTVVVTVLSLSIACSGERPVFGTHRSQDASSDAAIADDRDGSIQVNTEEEATSSRLDASAREVHSQDAGITDAGVQDASTRPQADVDLPAPDAAVADSGSIIQTVAELDSGSSSIPVETETKPESDAESPESVDAHSGSDATDPPSASSSDGGGTSAGPETSTSASSTFDTTSSGPSTATSESVSISGASDTSTSDSSDSTVGLLSYANDIQPIFAARCESCHGGAGWYGDGSTEPDTDLRIEIADRIQRTGTGKMPAQGSLTGDEITLIVAWAEQ